MKEQNLFTSFGLRFLNVLFLFLLIGCENSTNSPVPVEPDELEITYLDFFPLVTRPDEPFTLNIVIRGATGSEIHVYPSRAIFIRPDGSVIVADPGKLTQNGNTEDFLILAEDPTHPKPSPSETWFTANDILLPIEENGIETATVWSLWIKDPGRIDPPKMFQVPLSFRSGDPDIIGTPQVTELAPDVRATSRAVNIITKDVKNVERSSMIELANRYYSFFPDDRDFLIVQKPPNVDNSAGGWFFYSGEQEKGLGNNLYVNPSIYGSSGRLKGVIESLKGIYSLGPTGDEDFCLLTHELLHRWAAYPGPPMATDNNHWNFNPVSGLDRNQSGFSLIQGCGLNDFELYLAGLIPADSVNNQLNKNGYTIDDFISDNGPRDPAYPDAQRDFNLGFIVESTDPLSDHEMAYFHFIAGEVAKSSSPLAQTWYEATGKRSTLHSKLSFLTNNLP